MTQTLADLTETQFDIADAADLIAETEWAMSRGFIPSDVARRAKVATHEVYPVLDYMVEHRYLVTTGNGCRTRYYSRKVA